jgi:hypothetical protein
VTISATAFLSYKRRFVVKMFSTNHRENCHSQPMKIVASRIKPHREKMSPAGFRAATASDKTSKMRFVTSLDLNKWFEGRGTEVEKKSPWIFFRQPDAGCEPISSWSHRGLAPGRSAAADPAANLHRI